MAWVKIQNLAEQLQTQKTQLRISSKGRVVCTGDYTYNELMYKYPNFEFNYYENLLEPSAFFVNLFRQFIETNMEDIDRIYDAMNAEYNPIENYNGTETIIDGTKTDGGKVTTTPTGTSKTENTLESATYDNNALRTTDKNTQEQTFTNYKTETETSVNNNLTMTFDGTIMQDMHEIKVHSLKKSGNLGITTSQQMIESELELRKLNWISDIIYKFIKYYCVLSGGED